MFLKRVPGSASRAFATAASPTLSAKARSAAEAITANWQGTTADGGNTKNYIGGEFVESKATKWIDIHDPVSSQPPCAVPEGTHSR